MKKNMNVKVENDGARYYASLDGTMREWDAAGIKGCPMGRGNSGKSAIADLIRRIEVESNVTISVDR